MSEIDKLAPALVKAFAEMQNPKKDSKGNFNNEFASLEVSIDTIRPVFAKHGLLVMQVFVPSDKGVAVKAIIIHASGQMLDCGIFEIPVAQQDAQKYCSASTYARRFQAQALAFVTGEKDEDGNGLADKKKPVTPQAPVVPQKPATPADQKPDAPKAPDKPKVSENDSTAQNKPKLTATEIKWRQAMAECKKSLGEKTYYDILGIHGFESSKDVADRPTRKAVYEHMKQQIVANVEKEMGE
jgi:hypothetical protein